MLERLHWTIAHCRNQCKVIKTQDWSNRSGQSGKCLTTFQEIQFYNQNKIEVCEFHESSRYYSYKAFIILNAQYTSATPVPNIEALHLATN